VLNSGAFDGRRERMIRAVAEIREIWASGAWTGPNPKGSEVTLPVYPVQAELPIRAAAAAAVPWLHGGHVADRHRAYCRPVVDPARAAGADEISCLVGFVADGPALLAGPDHLAGLLTPEPALAATG
jgi:hypothetical protein